MNQRLTMPGELDEARPDPQDRSHNTIHTQSAQLSWLYLRPPYRRLPYPDQRSPIMASTKNRREPFLDLQLQARATASYRTPAATATMVGL